MISNLWVSQPLLAFHFWPSHDTITPPSPKHANFHFLIQNVFPQTPLLACNFLCFPLFLTCFYCFGLLFARRGPGQTNWRGPHCSSSTCPSRAFAFAESGGPASGGMQEEFKRAQFQSVSNYCPIQHWQLRAAFRERPHSKMFGTSQEGAELSGSCKVRSAYGIQGFPYDKPLLRILMAHPPPPRGGLRAIQRDFVCHATWGVLATVTR